MADPEQVLHDKMATTQACRAFGVDTSITLSPTGGEAGERPLSEHSLHYKISLVPPEGWAGPDWLGFGFGDSGPVSGVWPVLLAFTALSPPTFELQPQMDST